MNYELLSQCLTGTCALILLGYLFGLKAPPRSLVFTLSLTAVGLGIVASVLLLILGLIGLIFSL